MRLNKYLFTIALLMLFSFVLKSQIVDTGSPSSNWVDEPMCWSIGGIDSSLMKYNLMILGEADNTPIITKYFNADNQEVNVLGGLLNHGSCSLKLELESTSNEFHTEMCDYDSTTNKVFPFVRIFQQDSTFEDRNYYNLSYTPQYQVIVGQCSVSCSSAISTGGITNITIPEQPKIDLIPWCDCNHLDEIYTPYFEIYSTDQSGNITALGSFLQTGATYTPSTKIAQGACPSAIGNRAKRVTTSSVFALSDTEGYLSYSVTNTGWLTATITLPFGASELLTGETYTCHAQYDQVRKEYIYCPPMDVQPNGTTIHYSYRNNIE